MTRAVLIALSLATLAPPRARAFSDSNSFQMPVEQGGGGGRFFTGSPRDGFTCRVCHGEGVPFHMRVLGLPLAGYRPGTAYEVRIDWPDSISRAAMAVEFTNDDGVAAGTLHMPPEAELPLAERCGAEIAPGAGMLKEDPAQMRQVITMPDCGATHLRFLWVAPLEGVGRVWLSGSVVHSDGRADNTNDSVTDISRAIGVAGEAQPASEITGCSAVRAAAARDRGHGALLPMLTLLAAGARRRRSARACGRHDPR